MHNEFRPGMFVPATCPETGIPFDLEGAAKALASFGIPRTALEPVFDTSSAPLHNQVELTEYNFNTEGSLGYISHDTLKEYFETQAPAINISEHTRIWQRLGHINVDEVESPIVYMRHRNPQTGRLQAVPLDRMLYGAKESFKSDLFVSAGALYALVADDKVGGDKTRDVLKSYLNQQIERHRKLYPR